MVTRSHLVTVARELRRRLDAKAFLTLPRAEVTQLLRDTSGEDTTRIKAAVGGELEQALLDQAVRCFPGLVGTTTGDNIRLFHAGSVFGQLVDLIKYPDPHTDKDLGDIISKVKGKWHWATPAGPLGTHDDGNGRPKEGAARSSPREVVVGPTPKH